MKNNTIYVKISKCENWKVQLKITSNCKEKNI